MTTATITISDGDGETRVRLEFDPPLDPKINLTNAQRTALRLLQTLRNDGAEEDDE